jgi:hypothetical protein
LSSSGALEDGEHEGEQSHDQIRALVTRTTKSVLITTSTDISAGGGGGNGLRPHARAATERATADITGSVTFWRKLKPWWVTGGLRLGRQDVVVVTTRLESEASLSDVGRAADLTEMLLSVSPEPEP